MKKISFNADVNAGNPYEAHRLVSAMFPKQKVNYVNIDGQFEVYAENEPIIDEFAKRFNANVDCVEDTVVEEGKTYSITCKAAAKIKVKGDEYKEGGTGKFPVSYKSVSAKISNPKFFYITDAKEMKEWVRHNLAKNGCEIKLYDGEDPEKSDFIVEIDNEYATVARIPEKNETVLYHSFNALVKITDKVKFENLLRGGLGEGRFLGFGMVRI